VRVIFVVVFFDDYFGFFSGRRLITFGGFAFLVHDLRENRRHLAQLVSDFCISAIIAASQL